MTQAITTKFLGPTSSRGARIKAFAWAGSITIPYDHARNVEENHHLAAFRFAEKMQWRGQWHAGGLETGNVYVNVAGQTEPAFAI